MSERFQCCFCGKTIEPFPPDVGGLLYTTCIDGPTQAQHSQQLFCHTTCLTERLHSSVNMYVLALIDDEEVEAPK
jgi:hypothetical protein